MLKWLFPAHRDRILPGESPGSADREPVFLADSLERHLRGQVLSCWFPRCIDHLRYGYHQSYLRDWTHGPPEPKSLVFQSRMTWVTGTVARLRPDLRTAYLDHARHGLTCLRDHLWDKEHGGFFWDGNRGAEKHAYGLAFGILGAVAAHRGTGDPDALTLAQRAFRWLDEHAHDRVFGGYVEALNRDGSNLNRNDSHGTHDLIGTPYGLKSANTHLHLLEAFTELYRAWPDPGLRERLEESLSLLRDVMVQRVGYVPRHFSRDWARQDDAASFGHDLEAAFLLAEGTAVVGRPEDEETWAVVRRLTDHSVRYGQDPRYGGFFLEAEPGGGPVRREKVAWVQAEALNTLAFLQERFAGETVAYYESFLETWRFVLRRLADDRFGEWYGIVSEDGRQRIDTRKGHAWKAAYHTVRALLNAADAFRRLGARPGRENMDSLPP
jgi:mannobiose 2-epimerase